MSAVDVEAVGRTMRVLFERAEQPIVYHDPATGALLTMDPAIASAPDGFLPAMLVAGEAVWRETTGKGFGLDIQRDPSGLLGYRVRAIGAGSFSTVMLASIEALTQVSQRDAILVSEFNALWSAAMDRMRQEPPAAGQRRGAIRP